MAAYPRHSLEHIKYQQIISKTVTKFKGLAWLSYDEQFRRHTAFDLSIAWDTIDLELWTVTFSGLAKPHCSVCSSPYRPAPAGWMPQSGSQQEASPPSHSLLWLQQVLRLSAPPCHHPHVCRRCGSNSHTLSSKTDVYRQGQSLSIACCSSLLCPVSAIQQYFLLAQLCPWPLFYFQPGVLLTRSSGTKLLRDSARSAGLPYRSLKGHSFCIGATIHCFPDFLIKVLGRWSSDCYQLYIRTPESVLLSVFPRMASVSSNIFLG